MKRGFTVVELLVASLLLSMLVTMLTMIFNQSSIAWRAGAASVDECAGARECMGTYHDIEDDVLPGIGQQSINVTSSSDNRQLNYRTVSIWQRNADNQIRANQRAFELIDWRSVQHNGFTADAALKGTTDTSPDSNTASGGNKSQNKGQNAGGNYGFVVGVRSAGPDKKWDTEDDINTFPEDVE